MHHLFWSLIILFVFAALLRMDWAYYLVYVVGGVWLISHWTVRSTSRQLEITRTTPERAFAGQQIEASVTLNNHGWMPIPWLVFQERIPVELRGDADYRVVLSVGSRDSTEYRYALDCRQRGYYAIGPLSIHTGDLFGFAKSDWHESATPHLLVYPRVVPLSRLGLPSSIPFGQIKAPQRIYEDPSRLSGVRAYASGDTLRQVHWKATAHTDTLLVKKFQSAIALSVMVVVDLDRNRYPLREIVSASEWAIVLAASFANYVNQQRQPVGLITNAVDASTKTPIAPLRPRNGQEQMITLLSRLALAQLSSSPASAADWLTQPLGSLGWGTTLVMIAPQIDETTLWLLHLAHRRGAEVLALICAQTTDFLDRQAQARQLGVALHQVLWEKDLHQL